MISKELKNNIIDVFKSTYFKMLEEAKTSSLQLEILSHIIDTRVLSDEVFEKVWKKYDYISKIETDGTLGQWTKVSYFNSKNEEIDQEQEIKPILQLCLNEIKNTFLLETKKRFGAIFTEYKI